MRTAFVTILFVDATYMYIHAHMHVHVGRISSCCISTVYKADQLGRRVRKIIPSCAVTAIRRAFPELDNIYVGYKEYAAL